MKRRFICISLIHSRAYALHSLTQEFHCYGGDLRVQSSEFCDLHLLAPTQERAKAQELAPAQALALAQDLAPWL